VAQKKWIQQAIKNPGAFSKQAKAAGKSTQAYARQVLASPKRYSDTTVRRARLAQTLSRLSKKR
jgi:hypothetical protein